VEIKPATTNPVPAPATAPAPVPIRIPVRIPVPAPPTVLNSRESILSAINELAAINHTIISNAETAILSQKIDRLTEEVTRQGKLIQAVLEKLGVKHSSMDQDVDMN
jgi:hypothetical protein